MRLRKLKTLRLMTLAGLSAGLLFTSCKSTSTPPPPSAKSEVYYEEGVPGGTVVNTYEVTATVTGVDATERQVTLLQSDGTKTTFKAGPEVINFDHIRVGDQVRALLLEELVVFLREKGMPRRDGQAAMVTLAPQGTRPGGILVNTVEVTAKVKVIDLKRHRAILEFPDGTSRTVAVRPDVDLTKASVGQEVVINTTESVAIFVEKP